MINIRFLRSNISLLFPYLKLQKCIIIALTETWISNFDSDIFASILDFRYTLYLAPRQTGRGGGVGFMIRNDFTYLHPFHSPLFI